MCMVPPGERGWTKKAESVSVFASRAFVTVTLAANMKSDRVHPHGHFPRQLVSHSPTHWITQDAFLDLIDTIDAYMHARPGDAELGSGMCTIAHCCEISQHHTRHPAAHQTRDTLSRWTGRTCAPSRTRSVKRWPNTSPSSSWKPSPTSNMVNLDSSTAVLRQLLLSFVHTAAQNADSPQHRTAGWRFIDWNEVEQRELLAEAKRLLETGELLPRGTAEEPHAPDADARSQRQRARGARDGAPGRRSQQRQ